MLCSVVPSVLRVYVCVCRKNIFSMNTHIFSEKPINKGFRYFCMNFS